MVFSLESAVAFPHVLLPLLLCCYKSSFGPARAQDRARTRRCERLDSRHYSIGDFCTLTMRRAL
jgi:hypothetical protein